MDARMVHHFPASLLSLRETPGGERPPAPLGFEASRRSRLAVRVRKSLHERVTHNHARSRYPMESSRARACGNVLPDCRRGRDFHHLCCCVHLLHWQEPHGAAAAKCPSCSDFLHCLSALQQPHHSLCGETTEGRETTLLRHVVASDVHSRVGLPGGYSA